MLKIQTDWLNYLDEIQREAHDISLEDKEIALLKAQLRDIELLIPVIGEFSAGKSSLLNAFLGDDILPADLTPETELATELRYGEKPHLLALRDDGTSECLPVAEVKTIKTRAREFVYLQLYLDNERLKDIAPFVLVDMPGFGSSLENHNKAVARYLPRGAHFIVVISVENGTIAQSLVRQLDELQMLGREFTFVLSKTNLRADGAVQEVAELIDEQIQLRYENVRPVVRVGNKGGAVFAQTIKERLNPERIVRHLFEDQCKALTQSLFDQIGAAEKSLVNDKQKNEKALADLADGLRRIEQRRDTVKLTKLLHELEYL